MTPSVSSYIINEMAMTLTIAQTHAARIQARRDRKMSMNRYAGTCMNCSCNVPARAGWAVLIGKKWYVRHDDCNLYAEQRSMLK